MEISKLNDMICSACPRACGAVRSDEEGSGVCRMGRLPRLARAAAHMWEEPCISGDRGSGAVFFSGCALKCVYCQNRKISAEGFGKTVSVSRLREIFLELAGTGVHNINLVNPTHYIDSVIEAASGGLPVPLVWNSGGYDSVASLKRLEGVVDVYLPDMKYALREPARRCSAAADYPEVAKAAIREMFRQTGPYVMDGDGLLRRGVVIRHLILPENLDNTRAVIDWVSSEFAPGDVLFSLMSQYTPCGDLTDFPEISRRLTEAEYAEAISYLEDSGITDGFYQELSSAKEEYIPEFDLRGV